LSTFHCLTLAIVNCPIFIAQSPLSSTLTLTKLQADGKRKILPARPLAGFAAFVALCRKMVKTPHGRIW
jgi:hypothetical protein